MSHEAFATGLFHPDALPGPAQMPRYLSLAIEQMGCTTIDRRWQWNLANPHWRLYCNASVGAELTTSDGQRLALVPRQVYVIPPMRPVRSSCVGSVRHYFCHFQVTGVELGWATANLPPVAPAGQVDDWAAVFGSVAVPMELDRQWEWLAFVARHLAIAARYGRAAGSVLSMPEAHLHADLMPAMLAIEEAPEGSHTLRSLAQLCHLSREHFLRRFKKAHGVTPLDYVRQRRIRKSLALLADGRKSIPQIASECGFASRFHFTRLFTRYLAKSPGEYRRAHGHTT